MDGYFVFDDLNSGTYKVWIKATGTYNAASRRFSVETVPGRNGNLTIDDGVFEETEHTYECHIGDNFPANIQDFRNALMAKVGRFILTDSFHPDEFYRARYMRGVEPDVAALAKAGSFTLAFSRDPRRFLVSGNNAISTASTATEKTGSIVNFDNASGVLHVTDAEAEIAPVQVGTPSSLNPCPISGWTGLNFTRCSRNLFPSELPAHTINATVSGGVITSSSSLKMFAVRVKPNTDYYLAKDSTGTSWVAVFGDKLPAIGDAVYAGINMQNRTAYTLNSGNHTYMLMYATAAGFGTLNGATKHARVVEADMAHGWVANDGVTEAVDWTDDAGTVYGGTFDLATGVLSVTMGNIASYNGEVINEPWLSSLDEYAEGATPTIGAQVVYTLDAPVTYQLDPVTVSLLSGINSLYADCGDVKVKALDPVEIDNPTLFASKPLIRVYGQGTLYVGNTGVTVGGSYPYVDIDAELGDCYYGSTNANSVVSFSGGFPTLEPGANFVTYTGFSDVEITPRWWRL